jgi:hypothetical protein
VVASDGVAAVTATDSASSKSELTVAPA